MPWPRVKVESLKAETRSALVGGPFGSELTTRDYVEEGVPVIRGANLPDEQPFKDADFVFVSEEKADNLIANNAHPGDVIFTQRGTLGQVALIPSDARFLRYLVSQSQMKLTVNPEKADAWFVYYFFRHPDTVQTVKNRAITSGVPHINLGILRNFEMPLPPPLETQRKIVSVLSAYDDLLENNRRRMALLENAARLLYQDWFLRLRFPGHEHTRITKGIPQGWARETAHDALEILSGGTPKTAVPEFWGGEIPFYTPKDAPDGVWVTDCERTITDGGLSKCNSRLFPKETVFISARGTVGKLNMAQRPMAMSQSCYALVGKGHLTQPFVFCAMQEGVEALRQQAVGAVFDAIIVDTFKRIWFLVPELKTVRLFDEFARPVLAQLENLTLQNQQLRAARDLLLPRLMRGELAV